MTDRDREIEKVRDILYNCRDECWDIQAEILVDSGVRSAEGFDCVLQRPFVPDDTVNGAIGGMIDGEWVIKPKEWGKEGE